MASILKTRSTMAILTILVFAELTAAFETTMIMPVLKTLLQSYGRPAAVGWLVTSFLVLGAGTAAVCGRLGDLYGRKQVILVMLILTAVGSAISAFSPTLEGIIFGRAVQGFAVAILALAFGLAANICPRGCSASHRRDHRDDIHRREPRFHYRWVGGRSHGLARHLLDQWRLGARRFFW